ncbi:MAG: zf-HC2 domain-containing protein, partial [Aureliella sp.]
MMTAQCVSRDQLQEYLSGWAAPEQSEAIEAHLQECSACEQAAAELERGSDVFLESVRRSQTQLPQFDSPS